MAKAYTITSDPFYINGSITESGLNTYTESQISAPLDSLNREGLMVHAIYFTSNDPERLPLTYSDIRMQVTSTSKTNIVGANDANLLARREIAIVGGAAEFSGPHVVDLIANTDSYSPDMNLGLVATDNIYFAIQSRNQNIAQTAQFRAVVSRIKLSADAYAALVTNELSS